MRRLLVILGILAVVIVAAFVAFRAFQQPIGEALFARGVAANFGRDATDDLPDGLTVYVCGSGAPMPDPTRMGPCLGVVAGDKAFLFDVGSGAARRLGRMGFPINKLEGIYLTHLHSDHIDGLGEMLLVSWIGGTRQEPTPIMGPRGTSRVVSGLNEIYEIDKGYRIAHHGEAVAPPGGFGAVAEEIVLPGDTAMVKPAGPVEPTLVFEEGPLSIEAFPVSHAPVHPAFGFRITYKDRSVVFSGDTKRDPNIAIISEGADVLFHEALQPRLVKITGDNAAAQGNESVAKIMADIPDYHTSPEDAAEIAEEAGVGTLVLYHLVPAPPSPLLYPAFLGDAEDRFSGELIIAEDGMLISLPAGSDEVVLVD